MVVVFLTLFWIVYYIYFQTYSIYGGDGGDFVTAAFLKGIPHPPGFPLYTLVGHMLTKIQIGTIAWRVGLLSSTTSALTLVILYLCLVKVFKTKVIPLISVFILGFIYPFWLYASFPEVYAVNIFFTVLLYLFLFRFIESKKLKYLFYSFIVFGFALAHHQMIVFLIPPILYLIYHYKNILFKKQKKLLLFSLPLLLIGFVTYLYPLIASQSYPMISWNNTTNIRNLIKLVTKETYGVVYSGPSFAKSAGARLMNIPAYLSFILEDFTVLGFLLAVLGIASAIIKRDTISKFLLLSFFFTGPILYLYASFLITDAFRIAIFEQFLTFSYIFLIFFICGGLIIFKNLLLRLFKIIIPKIDKTPSFQNILYLFLGLFPLTLFYINYPKISILKNDFTAENFGKDILKTPDKDSILILMSDTPLFNSQYVYYTQKYRNDIKLFHYEKLVVGEYKVQLSKYFPQLKVTDTKGYDFLNNFVKDNYDQFPIYSNSTLNLGLENSYWVRYGLIYRLYKKEDIPSKEDVVNKNIIVWASYQDPLKGSLGKYQNLDLKNVLDFYEEAHRDTGLLFIGNNQYDEAIAHFNDASKLKPDTANNYYFEAQAYLMKKECEQAKTTLEKALLLAKDPEFYLLMSENYKVCFKNETESKRYYDLYSQTKEQFEVPVEKL